MSHLFDILETASFNNPFFFAPLFGVIPAIIWLWFWLKEDIHPEPNKFIFFTFLMGMLSVLIALPFQKITYGYIYERNLLSDLYLKTTPLLFFVWAGIEEILKFLAAFIGGIHNKVDDEPIDPIIYMIVSALGFVALENTLFLIDPITSGNLTDALITGNLRFIGATLLHVMASATVGLFLAFSFRKSTKIKILYGIIGIILSIVLHTYFNLFIISQSEGNIFIIFGSVWAIIILLMLMFERIKNS